MTPYIASYVVKYIDPDFNKGLVVWVSASALAAQGLFMPMGGILAPKLGVKLVVIIGSVINRYVSVIHTFITSYWAFY